MMLSNIREPGGQVPWLGGYMKYMEDIMREYFDKLKQTEEHLRQKIHKTPHIAIVLGSGLGSLTNFIVNKLEIPYDQIPNFPRTTVPGHEGRLIFGELGGRDIVAMKGRFHYYEGYPMQEVTFPVRVMKLMGVHPNRRLSSFEQRTFVRRWKQHRKQETSRRPTRGKVVYFHDTWATYNYPEVGMAAVKLLEAAGFEVIVEERRACCGRPALSKGLVDVARKSARRNVQVLAPYAKQGIPIVGTEPSCILTLRDEYRDLLPDDEDMQAVAGKALMFDELLSELDAKNDLGIAWKTNTGPEVLFHGHCHQKAMIGVGPSMAMLKASGCRPTESGAGCCGMAGSFGYEEEHYDVSRKIGEERLFPTIRETPMDVTISVAGVSCRQQVEHFTGRGTRHIAEVLASRIDTRKPWSPKRTSVTPDPAIQTAAD